MVCTSATIPGNIWEEFDNMEGLDVGEGWAIGLKVKETAGVGELH